MTTSLLIALTLAPLLAAPQTAPAGPAAPAVTDSEWAAWLGCWRAEDDEGGGGARLCVSPRADGGVTLLTLVGVQRVSSETRVADGTTRAIVDPSCTGTERVSWAADGRKLFRVADVTCGQDTPRHLASVSYLLAGPMLVDVQTLDESGAVSVRLRRYRRAADQTLPDGTPAAPRRTTPLDSGAMSRAWTVADIIEVSAVLPPDGVQAMLTAAPSAFALDAAALRTLAGASVSERVIDLMVALTYPARFVVQPPSGGGGSSIGVIGAGWEDPFFAPILGAASLYDCYSAYGWASSSYRSRCSIADPFYFGSPGYYSGFYGAGYRNDTWVIGTPGTGTPESRGRVVNGRGYVEIRPVEAVAAGSSGDRGTRTSSANGNGGTSTTGTATSGGYSGGGGGAAGGGERYAVPRPPGGQR